MKDSEDTLDKEKLHTASLEESYSTWQLPKPDDPSSVSPDYKRIREEINVHGKDLRHTFAHLKERLKHIQDFASYPDNLHLLRNGTNLISGGWWLSTYIIAENCRMKNCHRIEPSPSYQKAVNTVILIAQQLKEIRRANLRQKFTPIIDNFVNEFSRDPKTKEMMNQNNGLKPNEAMSMNPLQSHQIEDLSFILDTVSAQLNQIDFQTEADRAEAYHNREILHRSLDSKAWRVFRKTVELERNDLILDIVTATDEKCERLLRHLTKLNSMLLSGNVLTQLKCFYCLKTVRLVKSLKKWRVLAIRLLEMPNLPQEDRILLYSVTLDMKYSFEKIIQGIESLVFMLMELINVVYISSRYLKKTFQFQVKRYSALQKISKEYAVLFPVSEDVTLPSLSKETPVKTKSKKKFSFLTAMKKKKESTASHQSNISNNHDEDEKIITKKENKRQEEDPFYLRDYATIHRKNAITIGDLQLILQAKIRNRHSMMMIDGPRFLDLDLKHHIWLSKARKSLQKNSSHRSSRKIRTK